MHLQRDGLCRRRLNALSKRTSFSCSIKEVDRYGNCRHSRCAFQNRCAYKMPEETYHYPPDLFAAMADAIPLICRSKRDVLAFFRGAGVDSAYLRRYELTLQQDPDLVKKHIVTQELLRLVNEKPSNEWLRVRREIVKRVAEFENFEAPWPSDQAAARGAVSRVRELQNKKDAFTRMQDERDRERREHMAAKDHEIQIAREKAAKREALRSEFAQLFTLKDPYQRGKAFEALMNRLFEHERIDVRSAFTLKVDQVGVVEQIDGVIEIAGDLYLVEAKWWSEKLGPGDIAQHQVRVFNRGQVRGIFIVEPGYTDAAILSTKESLGKAIFVLTTIGELYRFFAAGQSIESWIRRKLHAAQLDKNPYYIEQPPE